MSLLFILAQVAASNAATQAQDKILNNAAAYAFGAVISILLLVYLVYALFKPEKF